MFVRGLICFRCLAFEWRTYFLSRPGPDRSSTMALSPRPSRVRLEMAEMHLHAALQVSNCPAALITTVTPRSNSVSPRAPTPETDIVALPHVHPPDRLRWLALPGFGRATEPVMGALITCSPGSVLLKRRYRIHRQQDEKNRLQVGNRDSFSRPLWPMRRPSSPSLPAGTFRKTSRRTRDLL